MITGSHNPPEYNGLKMMIDGVTLAEERIQTLLHNLQHNTLSEGSGDFNHRYRAGFYRQDAARLRTWPSVECGCGLRNGVAGA